MKTKKVTLSAVSLKGYCLPTFQTATLYIEGKWPFRKKYLEFFHYPTWKVGEEMEKTKIRVK